MSSSVFIRSIIVTYNYLTNRKCTFEKLSLFISMLSQKRVFQAKFFALNAMFYGYLSFIHIDDKKCLLWLLSDINFCVQIQIMCFKTNAIPN